MKNLILRQIELHPYRSYPNFFYSNVNSEPDIFKINVMGLCLTFIADKWSTVHGVEPNDDPNNYTYTILNKKGYSISRTNNTWCLKTPIGESLYFTDFTEVNTTTSRAYGYTNPAYVNIGSQVTMRMWMLNKIVTKYGKEVNITYTKTATITTETINDTYAAKISSSKITNINLGYDLNLIEAFSYRSEEDMATYRYKTTSTEAQLYIDKIIFPKGSISFTKSNRTDITNTQKLDKITIENINQIPVLTIDFTYDYFMEKTGSSKRLKLLSVKNGDANYSFIYNTTALPNRNSMEQDYWGYCNGMSNNQSLTPNPSRFGYKDSGGNLINNNNNKSANLTYTKSAILEEVIYPTGGKVCFEYELNQFNDYWVPDKDSLDNKISKGMGLRIKAIRYQDEYNQIVKQTLYEYSTGKSILKIDMVRQFMRDYIFFPYGYTSCRIELEHLYCVHASTDGFYSSNPLSSVNGVGYNIITKYETNNYNNHNGKIITEYHNNPDKTPSFSGNIVQILNLPAFKNTGYPENGSIKAISYFDKDNRLQKKISYEYQNKVSSLYYGVRTMPYESLQWGYVGCPFPPVIYQQHLVGFYPIFDIETLITNKTETDYLINDSIYSTEIYSYNSNNLISSIQYKVNGTFKYTDNYVYHPAWIGMPIRMYQSGYGPFNITHNYQLLNGKYVLVEDRRTDGYAYDVMDKCKITYYELYDGKFNLLQKKGHAGLVTTYLWSYNYQYPIAEIKNATFAEAEAAAKSVFAVPNIDSLSARTTPDEAKLKDGSLQRALPDAQVTTYTYKPLVGMTSATAPNGVTTNYSYDAFGRLAVTRNMDNNILASYRYAYQDGTEAPVIEDPDSIGLPFQAFILLDYSGNVKVTASVQITGGSGDYTISWQLKNESGTIVQLYDGPSFSFKAPASGVLTLHCTVTDNIKNISTTVSRKVIIPILLEDPI